MDRVLIHDISHWNGDLTKYWQLFKDKGCQAIIVKATEGYAWWNIFLEHCRQARDFGFAVGAYHYYREGFVNVNGDWVYADPTRQIQNFYDTVHRVGFELDLPPALDVEPANNPNISSGRVDKCLVEMERMFGKIPILYSNPSTLKNIVKPHWSRYPLWLAHYTSEDKVEVPSVWDTWTIWQFSDRITYTPIGTDLKKPIDHNYFNGDIIDFCLWIEKQIPPTPEPDEPRDRVKITANFLRGRSNPKYFAGTSEVIFERGQILFLTDEAPVYEEASGITWVQVEVPSCPCCKMWISSNPKYIVKI